MKESRLTTIENKDPALDQLQAKIASVVLLVDAFERIESPKRSNGSELLSHLNPTLFLVSNALDEMSGKEGGDYMWKNQMRQIYGDKTPLQRHMSYTKDSMSLVLQNGEHTLGAVAVSFFDNKVMLSWNQLEVYPMLENIKPDTPFAKCSGTLIFGEGKVTGVLTENNFKNGEDINTNMFPLQEFSPGMQIYEAGNIVQMIVNRDFQI